MDKFYSYEELLNEWDIYSLMFTDKPYELLKGNVEVQLCKKMVSYTGDNPNYLGFLRASFMLCFPSIN